MDINEKITRNKKVEHKPEPKNEAPHVFDLHCSVELLGKDTDGSENYKVTGKVHAEQMDADLMSTILAKIIKTSVPNNSIEDVIDKLITKLGLIDEKELKKEGTNHEVHICKDYKEDLIKFISKILGE